MAAVTSAAHPPDRIPVFDHPSPAHSAATTPANNSPSPSPVNYPLPLHNRQSRRSNVPLYVPAALRPSGSQTRSCPPTPPRSVHGSPSTLNDGDLSNFVNRRAAMESNLSGVTKTAEHQWMKNEHLGEVTGQPTRDHWKVSIVVESRLELRSRRLRRLFCSDLLELWMSHLRYSYCVIMQPGLTPDSLTLSRPIRPLPAATPPPAAPPSAFSCDGTTVAIAAISSATPTPPTSFPSIRGLDSTLRGSRPGPAIFAGAPTSGGKNHAAAASA